MQYFILSNFLVASALAASIITDFIERLPASKYLELFLIDPPGFIFKWEPVESNLEPVLGYKVRVYEAQEKTIFTFEENGEGKWVSVKKNVLPELSDFKPQDGKLHEYILTGANHTQLAINNVKVNVPYKFEVLAFGASGDGYSSSYLGSELGTINGTRHT